MLTWEGAPGAAFELIVDCQAPKSAAGEAPAVMLGATRVALPVQAGKFVRTTITVRNGQATIAAAGGDPATIPLPAPPLTLGLNNGGAAGVAWANLYLRGL
jgi:hypothetical protein